MESLENCQNKDIKKYHLIKYSILNTNSNINDDLNSEENENQIKNESKKKLGFPLKSTVMFRYNNPISLKNARRITNRQKRSTLLKQYPFLRSLSNCNSKIQMKAIFLSLTPKWKGFLRFYLSKCFIYHLFIRQIKNLKLLMQCRNRLFDAIDDPKLINSKLPFTSNLVKNFCKGVSNFVVMFHDELKKEKIIPSPKFKNQIM
jgi:hypothetical protein